MKACLPPLLVLLLLLGAALFHAACLERETERWAEPLAKAEALSDAGDWGGASDALQSSYRLWHGRQTWLHITISHDSLNAAELSYRRAFAFALGEEEAEFRAALAEVRAQFQTLTEMERLSLGNVL